MIRNLLLAGHLRLRCIGKHARSLLVALNFGRVSVSPVPKRGTPGSCTRSVEKIVSTKFTSPILEGYAGCRVSSASPREEEGGRSS